MANNNTSKPEVTGWVGWVYFAGFLLLLSGSFQIIAGLVALLNDQFYAVAQNTLVVFDITTWGWIHLVLGILLLVVASSVFDGRKWARVVATILTLLYIIGQFTFINVYPIWSIISITLGIFIVYALTVHGNEADIE